MQPEDTLEAERLVKRLGGAPVRRHWAAPMVAWMGSVGLHAGLALAIIASAATAAHFASKPPPPPALVLDFQQPVYAPTASLAFDAARADAGAPARAATATAPDAAAAENLRASAADALAALRRAEPTISLAAHRMGRLGGESRPIQVDFVGLRASNARRIVYVVDASGSLVGSFPQVLEELRRSLMKLDPRQSFGVIFIQRGDALTVPPGGALQPATPERLSEAMQWIESKVMPTGRSNPVAALEAAMALKPEIVFLLSADITGAGEFEMSEKALLDAVDRLNPRDASTGRRAVRIECVQFLDPDPVGTLERLAREHGGADGYRYLGRAELGLEPPKE